jgi:hypothetical protein
MEDTYTPQAVNQARNSFKKKVRKASATFFYGAMCGFFTTDELDDLLFEASEVARFLLEIEGTTLDIDEEIDIEDRITKVMRSVGEAAKTILKSRAEEGESYDQLLIPSPQKPKTDNNSAINNAPSIDKTVEDKIPEDHDPTPNAHSREILRPPGQILPEVDKKIPLDGSITMSFISGDVPSTRNQEKISNNTVGQIKTKLQENNGT